MNNVWIVQIMALTAAAMVTIFSPTFFAVPSASNIIGNPTGIAAAAVAVSVEPETFPTVPSSATAANWNFSVHTGNGGN